MKKMEIIAAINVVHQILELEEFNIDVVEIGAGDWSTALAFKLKDLQGGNLGDIESEYFDNLASIIDRLDLYHNDYLYSPFEKRLDAGEKISPNDWDREIIMFLNSDYCTDILNNISPAFYCNFVKTGFGSNHDRLSENSSKGIDDLEYLLGKDIAQKIISTRYDYTMREVFGNVNEPNYFHICVKRQGYTSIYNSYADVIKSEYNQVLDDIEDIGLTENGKWKFYISKDEMIYIGIDEEIIDNTVNKEHQLDNDNKLDIIEK